MRVAVLSGKGGAGKTFTAVNLAVGAGRSVYVDCDVEEPNGRLFLQPEQTETRKVFTLVPSFDPARCTGCRACVDFCRFNALIYIKEQPMLFPEICHSCGGCALVCPEHAVTEIQRPVGILELGHRGDVKTITGVLNQGEASGVPVIQAALDESRKDSRFTVIDCPPGSACSVMESVQGADFCLLVAEPTAFGFHNFRMVQELVSLLHKPHAVIINKADREPYEPLEQFLTDRNIPVWARIPYDPEVAAVCSDGGLAYEKVPSIRRTIDSLLERLGGEAR